MNIKDLVSKAHINAREKGFWEDFDHVVGQAGKDFSIDLQNNAIGNRLMLVTGEVAEAHEALRKADIENFKEELADIVIRVADLSGGLGIDLESEVLNKMEKNKARAYKHGKQF